MQWAFQSGKGVLTAEGLQLLVACCRYLLERAPRFLSVLPPDRSKYLTDDVFDFVLTGGVRDTYFLELPQPCTLTLRLDCADAECMLLVRSSGNVGDRQDGNDVTMKLEVTTVPKDHQRSVQVYSFGLKEGATARYKLHVDRKFSEV